ncbi:MAG: alpha-glucan family phosphorylase [Deltaproteobacteria bacterium]|nr:alpha-glucan family phosphorylase [Deltaproteobacteria bacterium]
MDHALFPNIPTVAYFSMEIGVDPDIPTYSGGLGLLAGDTLRAAADLEVPMVAITLLYRKGYFRQQLDAQGHQTPSPVQWTPEAHLVRLEPEVTIQIEGHSVAIGVWRYLTRGPSGYTVPVYLLDTDLPQNDPEDRRYSGSLYKGDLAFRLAQETVLGVGGIAMLRALGYDYIRLYHMNEGHSALLTLALLAEQMGSRGVAAATDSDRERVRQQCVFTTHTPVPAGHDQFPRDVVVRILGEERAHALEMGGGCLNGTLNMTSLALGFSRYVNGVAMRHGEVSRTMFPNYPISSITNGVHAATWIAKPFSALLDRYIPNWRRDNLYLRHAICIPLPEIADAHEAAKRELLVEVQRRTGMHLDPRAFTIGFARRAAAYKRADFLFTDLARLRGIVAQGGAIQVIYSGKAHPKDEPGKELIRRVFAAAKELQGTIPIVYLEDYDVALAKQLCAGVDVWLNTPQRPHEASGTSGMKAAMNGVPSLSILDGWWVEGHIEGVTGWAIGNPWPQESTLQQEVDSLYSKLETVILPQYYQRPTEFDQVRRSTIALGGSFFNTQRMLYQYLMNAYLDL